MELEASGLSHDYAGLRVLEDVSLQLRAGEILCLVGPSGCGKSTLLRLLGGLERPAAGQVWMQGQPPKGSLNPLTYVFQDFALLPWRTVAGNVRLVLEGQGLSRAEESAIVTDVLQRTQLGEFADAYPRQLSGGMQQRTAIARALAVRPAVMLMDEPLSALDAQTRELLLEDLVALWLREPFSACYVTHNLAEAVRLGHRVALMSRRPGRIRRILEIDLPLGERAGHAAELDAIEAELWQLLRQEALVADRELARDD